MRLFECQNCHNAVHFDNTVCVNCHDTVGYIQDRFEMTAFDVVALRAAPATCGSPCRDECMRHSARAAPRSPRRASRARRRNCDALRSR